MKPPGGVLARLASGARRLTRATTRRLRAHAAPRPARPTALDPDRARREKWEARWADPAGRSPGPRWYGRDLDPQIVQAVDTGWFPPGARALDAGCGDGRVAAFLADRGYRSVGADIAEGAIAEARRLHEERPGSLAFHTVDLCLEVAPGGPFDVVVDRGCLLDLVGAERRAYLDVLDRGCTPGARMLLSLRAYRNGVPFGDAEDTARRRAEIAAAFGTGWRVERVEPVHTDPERGRNPETALGGLLVWLERVPPATRHEATIRGSGPSTGRDAR